MEVSADDEAGPTVADENTILARWRDSAYAGGHPSAPDGRLGLTIWVLGGGIIVGPWRGPTLCELRWSEIRGLSTDRFAWPRPRWRWRYLGTILWWLAFPRRMPTSSCLSITDDEGTWRLGVAGLTRSELAFAVSGFRERLGPR